MVIRPSLTLFEPHIKFSLSCKNFSITYVFLEYVLFLISDVIDYESSMSDDVLEYQSLSIEGCTRCLTPVFGIYTLILPRSIPCRSSAVFLDFTTRT